MLGFDENKNFGTDTTHVGKRPVDFAPIKSIYIHLEQLNTSQNFANGAPSTILAVVPIENKEFGDIVYVRFEYPEFKYLSNGAITELQIIIRDENGIKINNNGLLMSAVLEII